MCWVMPPASPATTLALRIASRSLGLTVVDVAHDGDDRRTDLEILVGLVFELLVDVDVEAAQQLAVLVLRGDHLDLVAELFAEDVEGRLVEGLRGRRHLTEVEQHGHEVSGARVDLVGEVGDGCSAAQSHDGRAVATGNADASERRGFPQLEFCPLRPLRLACLALAAATTECTGRAAAGATTAAAATRRTGSAEAGSRSGSATGTLEAATRGTGAARSTGTESAAGACGTLSESAGTCTLAGTAGTRSARTRCAGTGSRRTRDRAGRAAAGTRTGCRGGAHALLAGERVVAGTRGAGALHALLAGEGVVAGTRGARTGRATGAERSSPVATGAARLAGLDRCRGRAAPASASGRRTLGRGGRRRREPPGSRRPARPGSALPEQRDERGRGSPSCALRRGGRARGGLGRGGRRRRTAGTVCEKGFLQPTGDGRFDARRGALDELAHFFELREGDLAVDAEFGGDFVYAWFCSHNSPVWGPLPDRGRPLVVRRGSFRAAHELSLISWSRCTFQPVL